MDLLDKIEKWSGKQPGIQSLVQVATDIPNKLHLLVVVDDHHEFIRKIDWI